VASGDLAGPAGPRDHVGDQLGTERSEWAPAPRRRLTAIEHSVSVQEQLLSAVDSGAARALRERNASLLPAGVTGVEGSFERGDSVEVVTEHGHLFARGMVNYSSEDLVRLSRKRSGEIEGILGYSYGNHAVHRNDLVCIPLQESETDAPHLNSA